MSSGALIFSGGSSNGPPTKDWLCPVHGEVHGAVSFSSDRIILANFCFICMVDKMRACGISEVLPMLEPQEAQIYVYGN